jgi:nucleoside-diphosphate-sugar epimerase
MKILVTGAGGVIGRVVALQLLSGGHEVVALVRKSESISFDHNGLSWCVGDVKDRELLLRCTRNVDIVVHLAAAKSDEKDSYEVNVGGAKNLLNVCIENRVSGIINTSTISTKLSEKGLYAKTKADADDVFSSGSIPTITLRPSIVYGDSRSGIFGTLIKFTKLPFVPVFGKGDFTFKPIHVSDFAIIVQNLISKPFTGYSVYDVGGLEEVSFNNMIQMISKGIHGKSARLMHIPVSIGFLFARVLRFFLKKPPLTQSNVRAMYQSATVSPEALLKRCNVSPRTLKKGLSDIKKQVEYMTAEPYVLMRYLSPKVAPSEYYVELYKKGIARSNLNTHTLFVFILKHPIFIGALDAITKFIKPNGQFQKKLLVAATIVECSPLSSKWLLPQETGLISFFLKLIAQGLKTFGKLFLGVFLLFVPGLIKKNA